MVTRDTAALTHPITTGTPDRGEIRPSTRGPAPSRQAAACARPAPMIQAEPLASSTQMNTAPHKADEFFVQEVSAVGPRIIITVNGKQTVDYTLPEPYFKKGHFALQGHDPGSVMTFKKVEVKVLAK